VRENLDMPYHMKDEHGATGIAEALWATGYDPVLYFEDALWTAEDAVAQGLRGVVILGPSPTRALEAEAQSRWELAFLHAGLEHELTDFPPDLAQFLLEAMTELDPDDDGEGDTGDAA
jgi:hypothetical protein